MSSEFENTVQNLFQMFEGQVPQSRISELFQKNNADIGQTVDDIIEEMSTVTSSSVNGSVSSSVHSVNKEPEDLLELDFEHIIPPAQPEPATTSTNELEELKKAMKELQAQNEQLKMEKLRAEEEKKNGMRWCLLEMQKLKETVQQKEDVIAAQSVELERLRGMTAAMPNQEIVQEVPVFPPPQNDKEEEAIPPLSFVPPVKNSNPLNSSRMDQFEHFITESKDVLAERLHILSEEVTETLARLRTNLKEEKDWDLIQKLKEFAIDIRRELAALFKDAPSFMRNNNSQTEEVLTPTPKPVPAKSVEDEEFDKDLWKAEKASLESYIAELEAKIKLYEAQL